MNIVQSIFKKKIPSKNVYRPIRHFEKIIKRRQNDIMYTKTTNILRRPITIFVYYEYLDIKLGVIHLKNAVSQKILYKMIQHFIEKIHVLLSTINEYIIYACQNVYPHTQDVTKINKLSDSSILNIILNYNSHKSYTDPNSKQRLPFLLNILIKPKQVYQRLYINYKNNILLCTLDECIVCFDKKYLKKICSNKHYCCFKCENLLKKYKTKICPMCRDPLQVPF